MQKRFSRGFYPLGSYTLSENIGDIDSNFSNAVPGVGNLGSARADRSPTASSAFSAAGQFPHSTLSWSSRREYAGASMADKRLPALLGTIER